MSSSVCEAGPILFFPPGTPCTDRDYEKILDDVPDGYTDRHFRETTDDGKSSPPLDLGGTCVYRRVAAHSVSKRTVGVVVQPGTFVNLWNNGMGQNVVTYCKMLAGDFNVHVICPAGGVEGFRGVPPEFHYVPPGRIPARPCDVYLEMAATTTPEQFDAIKQAKPSTRFVALHFGGARRILTASILSDKKMTIGNHPSKRYDECWTSPHYAEDGWFLRKIFRCDVFRVMPYVWDPAYIQEACDEAVHTNDRPFGGYVPSDPDDQQGGGATLVCLEPNIDVSKLALVPISIVDEAYKTHSDKIRVFDVYNARPLVESAAFRYSFGPSHQILRNGTARFWKNPSRVVSAKVYVQPGCVVVSHQAGNALNYVSLEALYLGIPLVHNSEELRDAGYYYPGSDIGTGAEELVRLLDSHDDPETLRGYREAGKAYVWKYSPRNPRNVRDLVAMVEEAMSAVKTTTYAHQVQKWSGEELGLKVVDLRPQAQPAPADQPDLLPGSSPPQGSSAFSSSGVPESAGPGGSQRVN